jgi:tRNA nucleotidyltransferase (CCA-adding enzyme)
MLYSLVRPRRLAADIMSAPAISIGIDLTCGRANEMLNRYNVNALLVMRSLADDRQQLVGYITRLVIEKALHHQLETAAVSEFMTTDIATVSPGADLEEIQDKIIGHKQRILPVVENDDVRGVITRTDLLNLLVRRYNRSVKPNKNGETLTVHARTRVVAKFMRERLSARIIQILRDIGATAEDIGLNAYVIGGFVRDLFLYRPNEDVDVVIEGDGIAFARRYARKVGARLHTHAKFGTAVVIFENGFKIDVASARMEYYKFPAALPTIEMSSLKLDLYRRDFSINTLCIHLNPAKFGTLIDFFSAQKDLKEKTIRVLHNLSFVEDPTRAFRAIRFEQRFGFTIGKLTANLIQNAVRMDFFKRLSGKRVFTELRQILAEDNPGPAVVRLQDYELLKVVHPSIELTPSMISLFSSIRKVVSWYDLLFIEESYKKWSVYFLGMIRSCDLETTRDICRHFELPPRVQLLFTEGRFAADRCLNSIERTLPSENSRLYRKLVAFRIELILYMMAAAKTEKVRKSISHYCVHLRFIRPILKGQDLKSMGLAPGPRYRLILDELLNARLNGQVESREDEVILARQLIEAA